MLRSRDMHAASRCFVSFIMVTNPISWQKVFTFWGFLGWRSRASKDGDVDGDDELDGCVFVFDEELGEEGWSGEGEEEGGKEQRRREVRRKLGGSVSDT